jgi:hypothetical protein
MVLGKAFVVLSAMFLFAASAVATEVEGVKFPDTVKADGQDLAFNGGGRRTKFGLKMYDAGLYLKQKSGDAAGVVSADEPMSMRLQITSGLISPDKMKSAVMEGFEKSTNGNIAPLKARIDTFVAVFKELDKNDVYDFANVPLRDLARR